MKIKSKVFRLGSLFAALLLTGALAVGYGGYAYSGEKTGQAVLFTGSLIAMDEQNQLLVKTTVPGLLGPEERTFPFRIDRDSTVTICFKSIKQCDSGFVGQEGWNMLKSLEDRSDFSAARKDVKLVQEPETGHTAHVEIDYNM